MPASPGKAFKTHLGASKPMIERISALVGLLQTKGAATSRKEVVKRLNRKGYRQASVRTVQRDINFLKRHGYDIQFSKTSGYTCRGGEELMRDLLVERDELLPSLALTRALISSVAKLDPASGVDLLLAQVGDVLERQGLGISDLSACISTTSMAMSQRLVPVFRTLVKAVIQRHPVEIGYMGNSDFDTNERVIEPYHLLESEGRWYCIAFCRQAAQLRTFAVSRMEEAKLFSESFERPEKMKNADFWEKRTSIFGIWHGDGEPIKVELRMTGYAARLVQESGYRPQAMRCISQSANPGVVRLKFECHRFEELVPWIMKWGPYCKVLSPPELAEQVQDVALRTAALYSSE